MNQDLLDRLAHPFPESLTPFQLDRHETAVFMAGCREIAGRHSKLDLNDDAVLAAMVTGGRHLPDRLLEALARFRWESNEHGALLIRGVPLDPTLPGAPSDGSWPAAAEVPICTIAQLTILSQLGDLISYAGEKAGALVQDVVALRGMTERQENVGSSLLELHTENGFHPHKPDFVTLLCLRGDPDRNAQTVVASVRNALPLLSRDSVDRLCEETFRIAFSSSFVGPDTAVYSAPLAALSVSTEPPTVVADLHAMKATTDEGRTALGELFAALRRVTVGVRLLPGDLLIIDNRTSVHGRTSFVPRFDGHDRWLRRAFAVRDLRRCVARRSRVVRP